MSLTWLEHAARAFEPPPAPRWATPGALAVDLDPKTRQTPALDLIDAELVRAATTPDARLIISMPPQEGKSQRASRLGVAARSPCRSTWTVSWTTGRWASRASRRRTVLTS